MYAQGSSVYHSSYNAFLSPGETLAELSDVRLFFWSFFFTCTTLSLCVSLPLSFCSAGEAKGSQPPLVSIVCFEEFEGQMNRGKEAKSLPE